ncbi:RhoGEF Rgf2 [Mycena leptocephala]|nr:RhoGEF Rgf2 [Mycena leptocephala]
MVDAKVQDHILKLLKSQNVAVVGKICHLMAQLAGHELTAPAILQLNLLKQLVVLAGSHFWSAIDALRAISQWPDGVAALANIDVFEELQHLDHDHLDAPELHGNITLLLDAVLKHSPDNSPDKVILPQVVPQRVSDSEDSSSSIVAAPRAKRPPQPIVYPAPIVSPALLSRVAEAFRARVPRADRVKDGLTYHDVFDGREAVDHIAHMIKTTDRNLALLLGRALDAQNFFHDVTYGHRLRDSVVELYQFRTKLPSPFGSGELAPPNVNGAGGAGGEALFGAPAPPGGVLSPDSFDGPAGLDAGVATVTEEEGEEEAPLPSGVFTLLADCYSPTCSRDQLCYSIACPRRLKQLNMKPQPGWRKEASRESFGVDEPDAGMLWIHSVPAEIAASVSDAEKKRQKAINKVIYTERVFVRDMEYLRDAWVARLAVADIIPQERREQFLTQVRRVFLFFFSLRPPLVRGGDADKTRLQLRDALIKRQQAYAVVGKIGDIFLDAVPHFEPFVSYGAHQLYGKYEFEKEKSANPAFAAFVETTERLPESRKLELNAYLTKPTTRLAWYPLLLEAVLKHTPEDSPDKVVLPHVVAQMRAFLSRVNEESGRAENHFNLAQLDSQLVFKPGEQVDLRLQDEGRELVYKGVLNKRDGELQVYLFDHALLFGKPLKTKTHEQCRVYRRPIPLELLLISASEEASNGNSKDTLRGQRARQLVRKSSFGSNATRGSPHPPAVNIRPDAKGPHWITFTYLGRRTYSLALWANSTLAQRKWVEQITKRQTAMRERSTVFDTIALSEGFFSANKVNCAAPFSGGRRIVYGTDDGVYISDLRDISKEPVMVLALFDVIQVDVLEDYQLLIVLSERQVLTFPLDALDPMDSTAGLIRAKRIATHTSFFKTGFCLGRVLGSSTFKVLEPIEPNVRGRAKPTFKKLLQGGNDTLKPFRLMSWQELYLPVESTQYTTSRRGCALGPRRALTLLIWSAGDAGLLDPRTSRSSLSGPGKICAHGDLCINNDFLLCYDEEFAFYVNKTGRRSRKEFMVFWEGTPTGFGWGIQLSGRFRPLQPPNSAGSRAPAFNQYALPSHMQHPNQYPHQQHRYPQGVGRDEILMVSDDRVLALRTAAGPQRFMSDNVVNATVTRRI